MRFCGTQAPVQDETAVYACLRCEVSWLGTRMDPCWNCEERDQVHLTGHASTAINAAWFAEKRSEHAEPITEATRRACGHVWPSELSPDALCDKGCGATYELWSTP